MTRIAWGTAGARYFEAGTDRGVLYVNGVGVPWNGLTGVSESPDGGEPQPFYVDGYKYLNLASAEEFKATVNALSSPPEFAQCDGTISLHNGLFATQQPRKSFDMSYRTLVGNDISGIDHGYKLHIVYNALAAPSTRENASTGDKNDPLELSWGITTTPPRMDGMKPTAHLVIDSRLTPPRLMDAIEDILYGSDDVDARLPDQDELITLFNSMGPLIATNLCLVPSFEKPAAAPSIIRRNYILGPLFSASTDNWAIGPSCTWGSTTADGREINLPAGFGNLTSLLYFSTIASVAGDVWSGGFDVEVPIGSPAVTLSNRVYWGTPGFTNGPNVTINSGERKWIAVENAVAPSGTTVSRMTLTTGAAVGSSGAKIIVHDGPTAEKRSIAEGPLSGNSVFDSDFTVAWEGAVNASNSTVRVTKPFGVADASFASGVALMSTQWAKEGAYSVRVRNEQNNGADSFAQFTIAVETGKTYTVLATGNASQITTDSGANPSITRRRTICVYGGQTNGAGPADVASAPVNLGAEETVRLVFTAQGTGNLNVRLYNGSERGSIGGDMFWDLVTVVEGAYLGPAFSGDTDFPYEAVCQWLGETHNSQSTYNSWY